MAVNRGKDFESAIYNGFKKIQGFTFDRLPDPMAGYAGVKNICDYFGYRYPNAYYIECKSCYGNRFPFYNITANQWTGLLDKADIPGVIAGYMVWYIDHDITVFFPSKALAEWKNSGKQSVSYKDLDSVPHIKINGKKKKIMFDYDLTEFVNEETQWV